MLVEFVKVYQLIKSTSSSREKFLVELLRRMDCEHGVKKTMGAEAEDYYKQMSTLMAALPYEKEEEPLFVMSRLDQMTALLGETLLEFLKKLKVEPAVAEKRACTHACAHMHMCTHITFRRRSTKQGKSLNMSWRNAGRPRACASCCILKTC